MECKGCFNTFSLTKRLKGRLVSKSVFTTLHDKAETGINGLDGLLLLLGGHCKVIFGIMMLAGKPVFTIWHENQMCIVEKVVNERTTSSPRRCSRHQRTPYATHAHGCAYGEVRGTFNISARPIYKGNCVRRQSAFSRSVTDQ